MTTYAEVKATLLTLLLFLPALAWAQPTTTTVPGTLFTFPLTLPGELVTAASTTSSAGLNLPQGTAPTSPSNGDVWTTSLGMYARINGSTVGPFGAAGGSGITIGTTTITSGTSNGLLYNNSGLAGNTLAGLTGQILVGTTSAAPSWSASPTLSGQLTLTIATGTAPFVVSSTTNVPNLNASSLNGATFAAPGSIGFGTPSSAQFTTLTAISTTTLSSFIGGGATQCLYVNNLGVINTTGAACGSGGGGAGPYVKFSNYTLNSAEADNGVTIEMNCSSACTVSFPSLSSSFQANITATGTGAVQVASAYSRINPTSPGTVHLSVQGSGVSVYNNSGGSSGSQSFSTWYVVGDMIP